MLPEVHSQIVFEMLLRKKAEVNKCFALSLACPYLNARDLLALSLTGSSVRIRLKNGSARTLRMDISGLGREKAKTVLQWYSRFFPHAKEIVAVGTREEIMFALQGAAKLPLTRLSITLQAETWGGGESPSPDRFLDGNALAAACGGFPLLQRIEMKNIGPFSPRAFVRSCSASGLQMIRLSKCPTLMDSCLSAMVLRALSLLELSVDECPSLICPVLKSNSLIRLKLSKCFSLQRVNVSQCPNLVIVDFPWTVFLVETPPLWALNSLRYLSLAGAARLESFEIERLPSTVSSIDLGSCTKLKSVAIRHCPNLVYLNVAFCIKLESIVLTYIPLLEELDLSLLTKLKCVELTEDLSLKKLLVDGCDKLRSGAIKSRRISSSISMKKGD